MRLASIARVSILGIVRRLGRRREHARQRPSGVASVQAEQALQPLPGDQHLELALRDGDALLLEGRLAHAHVERPEVARLGERPRRIARRELRVERALRDRVRLLGGLERVERLAHAVARLEHGLRRIEARDVHVGARRLGAQRREDHAGEIPLDAHRHGGLALRGELGLDGRVGEQTRGQEAAARDPELAQPGAELAVVRHRETNGGVGIDRAREDVLDGGSRGVVDRAAHVRERARVRQRAQIVDVAAHARGHASDERHGREEPEKPGLSAHARLPRSAPASPCPGGGGGGASRPAPPRARRGQSILRWTRPAPEAPRRGRARSPAAGPPAHRARRPSVPSTLAAPRHNRRGPTRPVPSRPVPEPSREIAAWSRYSGSTPFRDGRDARTRTPGPPSAVRSRSGARADRRSRRGRSAG